MFKNTSKITSILLIGLAISIITINLVYGNAISALLSTTIVGIILTFIYQLYFEGAITKFVNNAKDKSALYRAAIVSKDRKRLISFALLSIVFLSSIWTVNKVTNPKGSAPYFYNNEHHALSNAGIGFKDKLTINKGKNNNETLTFSKGKNDFNLHNNDLIAPIFLWNKGSEKYDLINPAYHKTVKKDLTISNRKASLSLSIKHQSDFLDRLLGKAKTQFTITVNNKDPRLSDEEGIPANLQDSYTFERSALQYGISLYDLFFQQKLKDKPKAESLQLVQELLHQIGDSYLLSNHKEKGTFHFYPNKKLIKNGLTITIDGVPTKAQFSGNYSIPENTDFYIGFNNQSEQMQLVALEAKDYQQMHTPYALVYDHPPTYWLSNKDEEQYLNTLSSRFLTNSFDDVIQNNSSAGFYFNNFGIQTKAKIKGHLQYQTDQPHNALSFIVQDFSGTDIGKQINQKKFALNSSDASIQYLFELRDFSDNKFSTIHIISYLSVAFLGLLVLLLFFPGKNLGRIEPIIATTIYTFLAMRLIMSWRIATFPPIEHISKHELEQTMINFDFNFGWQLPIPLTLIWLLLFIVFLIIYRLKGTQIKSKITPLIAKRNLVKTFGIIMLSYLVVYLLNQKLIHIGIFTRVIGIIVPIITYFIFSHLNNQQFTLKTNWVTRRDSKWVTELKAYFYYFINNPTSYLSIITLSYFVITDRGFAVVFLLFLILKNILLNFLKKQFNSQQYSFWNMLLKPNNYWIYGIAALVLYMTLLVYKSFFYYLLQYYYFVIIGIGVLVVGFIFLFLKNKKQLKITSLAILALVIIVFSIPTTRTLIDNGINSQIKHVKYRISILHQPISELLKQNDYSSFSTQKIIETAENQWFINSYISKEYDRSQTLNLRPYNRVGVNYNTQTRDVVLARFVISEMGNLVMYLLLILSVLPLVLYLSSYQFSDSKHKNKILPNSYLGALPLIFFFTIALFVWLTSTNRFVFFGQDFPFLSLTSRTSVVLPLLLFGVVLISNPKSKNSTQLNIRQDFTKYSLFIAMIAFFALITIQPNQLSSKNFSILVKETQEKINGRFNTIFEQVQEQFGNKKFTYTQAIQALQNDSTFQSFRNNDVNDKYTQSIIENIVNNPYSAFEVNSPVYMNYNSYSRTYSARYNQHFYLELPNVDPSKVWHGSITEADNISTNSAVLNYNGEQEKVQLPYFKNDMQHNVQLALLPASWFANTNNTKAIIDVNKTKSGTTKLSVYKDIKNTYLQKSTSFASAISSNDLVSVSHKSTRFNISFNDDNQIFAFNKWINGGYRILYPHRPKNLWLYHFSKNIKSIYDTQKDFRSTYSITLDHQLNRKVEQQIYKSYEPVRKSNRFKFSVITAEGSGKIRLMQDFVANRKAIDPNDNYALYQLQRQQFFYSNIRNERDQWGETNLLSMQLGPGSSIKPLIAATVASQVNAGWEHLQLSAPTQSEYTHYAGLELTQPWKNDDHYKANINLPKYIEASSNFYQSLLMFLGSYPKNAFIKEGKASLKHLLATEGGKSNTYPKMIFNEQQYYLPNFRIRKTSWPKTNYATNNRSYFGNENAILATGLEVNANIITKEKNKNKARRGAYDRINIIDSTSFTKLKKAANSSYLWSMPEESTYLQSLKAYDEIHQNFNIGIKTNTLGGYPYQLSPYKVLESYMSLFSFNRSMRLHIDNRQLPTQAWHIDSTWQDNKQFKNFLAANIFKGMHDVIFGASGTAKRLAYLKSKHPQLHFYAKTGTINEQGSLSKSSRRLIVIVTNKDLKNPSNIGQAKVYSFYFTIDRAGDFNWSLLNSIIETSIQSTSFKQYFNLTNSSTN